MFNQPVFEKRIPVTAESALAAVNVPTTDVLPAESSFPCYHYFCVTINVLSP